MLKKLLKYEFKATARTYGGMYLALLAASVLFGGSVPPDLTISSLSKHRFSVVFCFTSCFKIGLGYFLGTKAGLQSFETTS